jgi:DNA (cytosine-5)-methyltransferase 1
MFKVLDLFSGIGGFSLGLEATGGFETVAFCEIEPYPIAVLKKHWPNIPVYKDVKTLTKERLDADGIFVDVICGGFPCQDISLAGKGAGIAGERSGLWFEFHRLIKEIKPKVIIAENVSALRSRGLEEVLRSLFEIGYDAEWHCIPASAVGAPHRRDRIWIVAYPNTQFGRGEQSIGVSSSGKTWDKFGGSHSDVANASGKRLQRDEWQRQAGTQEQPSGHFTKCSWWDIEPNVGRMADGVSHRAHRLRALGNAVVPQIPQMIGKAILNATSH